MAPDAMVNYVPYLIALGVIVLFVLICCCCCLCRRSGKKNQTDIELNSVNRTRAALDTPIHHVDTTDGRNPPRDSVPTLDLHGKNLKGAMATTKTFIKKSKDDYLAHGGSRYVNVIPGRGLHSKNGVPVLKPNVENYLGQKGLNFHHENRGGQLVVDLGS